MILQNATRAMTDRKQTFIASRESSTAGERGALSSTQCRNGGTGIVVRADSLLSRWKRWKRLQGSGIKWVETSSAVLAAVEGNA